MVATVSPSVHPLFRSFALAIVFAVVRLARGVLLLALDLTLFTLLWLFGRAARGEPLGLRSGWLNWRGSFRARVTATLFFFFLIPTAVFGWVAFRALAREVTRATRIVAERAVRQAVVEFQDSRGDLGILAAHTGADVLYYFQGELARASSPEAPELGVYGAWMPASVFLGLAHGDENSAVDTRQIAGQNVLTAYRTLVPAGTLAVPMPLESGETALRQRELAHLILFAALVGGLLSLLLSVVVGRALTGPIGELQRAAAQVGAGNLRVRLPEQTRDEFGELYATFNRMVRRLRRARTQQTRTARVLAWGEMAKQVAHEIKNPLTPIKLAVQHLKRAYADRKTDFGEVLDRSVEQILLEIDRLSEIARAFSRYGAPTLSSGPLEPVNLNQVITEALTLYRAGDPEVEYTDDVEPDVPRALGRSGEVKEVLLNLLENARAALDGVGGRIVVTAHRQLEGIELTVSDNGRGIPADFLPRVFEPHFSTRSAGTGLGLAIVRRLVESWGGTVTAQSEQGVGTTIRVILREAEKKP
jgi:signal transduction histidine kinase